MRLQPHPPLNGLQETLAPPAPGSDARHSSRLGSFPSRRAAATHSVCACRRRDVSPSGAATRAPRARAETPRRADSGTSSRPGFARDEAPTSAARRAPPSCEPPRGRDPLRRCRVAEAHEVDERGGSRSSEVRDLRAAASSARRRSARTSARSRSGLPAAPSGVRRRRRTARPSTCNTVPSEQEERHHPRVARPVDPERVEQRLPLEQQPEQQHERSTFPRRRAPSP